MRICRRNCVEDGSWPPGAGLQGLASNHPRLLRLRDVVVSAGGKGGGLRRQVSDEKMSASEPSMTHRNGSRRCQNGHGDNDARKSVGDTCLRSTRQPVYRRHDLITGFNPERGNLARGAKGNPQVAHTTRENTKTRDRDGAACSSAEAAVMAMERRGCVILSDIGRQPALSGGAS